MRDAEARQVFLLRYLDGNLRPEEEAQVADLLRRDPQARSFLRDVAEQAVTVADVERAEQGRQIELTTRRYGAGDLRVPPGGTDHARKRLARWPLVATALAVVVLLAGVLFSRPSGEPQIATITGLSGSLQWTGDGGRVIHGLTVGTELSGGTIEGMAPDSWFELEFNDGSTVAMSGNSMITFSDHGQKELRLKEGSFSASVVSQAEGKPMLIHTRAALLEVLGTRFEVEAGLFSTIVNVSEGKVRVKRVSDGRTIDVPANHRVIAAADRAMSLVRMPASVDRWKSRLRRGPRHTYGEWTPDMVGEEARLKTIPYTTDEGKTIYTASLRVSSCGSPPVVLQQDSRIRVRGRIASANKVYFGMTLRQANGAFAGRFQIIRPADEFPSGQEFEVVLAVGNYQLDPSLNHMKSQLPSVPFDLIVESIWCHTLHDQAGLAISEVELIPPDRQASEASER